VLVATALLSLAALGQAVLSASLVPDPDLLGAMAAASLGVSLALALPLGVLGGIAAGYRRLREEGAVLALGTLGAAPTALAAPVIPAAALTGILWAMTLHFIEPSSRASLRDARVLAAARASPAPGHALQLGDWSLAAVGGELRFAGQDWVGMARTWSLAPARGGGGEVGVVARLRDGRARRVDGEAALTFAELTVPITLPGISRVHAAERPTPELVDHLRRTTDWARAYETWILWKRTLLPALLPVLAWAAAGHGLSRRPLLAGAGGLVLALWVTIRLADQAIRLVQPGGAAALVVAVAALGAATAWRGR
jgi:hypothetical protein